MTPEGHRRIRAEYEALLHGERPRVVEVVSWAAGNGDRSENGDYQYGKKRLREIDRRVRYLGKRLDSAEGHGAIFDGFPRTQHQAEALEILLGERRRKLDYVIELVVDEEALVTRITGRFTCANCGAPYHDQFHTPRVEGTCDNCGNHEFKRRPDDNGQTVRTRMAEYRAKTAPILPFYRDKGLVRQVDGMASVEAVAAAIDAILDGMSWLGLDWDGDVVFQFARAERHRERLVGKVAGHVAEHRQERHKRPGPEGDQRAVRERLPGGSRGEVDDKAAADRAESAQQKPDVRLSRGPRDLVEERGEGVEERRMHDVPPDGGQELLPAGLGDPQTEDLVGPEGVARRPEEAKNREGEDRAAEREHRGAVRDPLRGRERPRREIEGVAHGRSPRFEGLR